MVQTAPHREGRQNCSASNTRSSHTGGRLIFTHTTMTTTEDQLFICLRLARAAKRDGLKEDREHYVKRAWMHRANLRKA